jgi:hypothetical protein
MAQNTTSQQSGGRRGKRAASGGRAGSSGTPKDRRQNGRTYPARQARRTITDANREYRRYEGREEQDPGGRPDVLLDVPELGST